MKTSDFDFDLPERFIAQDPAVPRDSSKMLAFNSKTTEVEHLRFGDIAKILGSNDCLLVNSSKVIPARIEFHFEGRAMEIFVLKSLGEDVYSCMVKPGKYFSPGAKFTIKENVNCVVLEVFEDGSRSIKFDGGFDLDEMGSTPLPPYIKKSHASREQYQTVYSDIKGSVAAPTAGLHFTDRLIDELCGKGVSFEKAALHVGRGTFMPVISDELGDHVMHSEDYILNDSVARRLSDARAEGKRLIAVGTTAVRVLESSFNPESQSFLPGSNSTDLFIYPGAYQWKTVDALITNFHLPKSTLLMLVSSFLEHKGLKDGRKKILELYALAMEKNYRFYSFGDSMFIY